MIVERIRVKTETEIADEQAGFRQGRGQETKCRGIDRSGLRRAETTPPAK